MTLRWRLTLNTLALITALLLLLTAYGYYSIRTFLLDSESVRIRAQAKPIIDAALLDRPVNEDLLARLANQLATDLTSADTGALVVDRHGEVIGRHLSEIGEPVPPELPRAWYAPALRGQLEQDHILRDAAGNPTLVVLVPIPPREQHLGVVVLSTSLQDVFGEIRQQVFLTVLASLGILIVAAVLTYLMVKVSLRPLERMITVADEIARGDLSQRVQLLPGSDEVGRLAHSLDRMADHIQLAFEAHAQSEDRLRQFLADISHELRTPLTAIGGYVDLLLKGVGGKPGPNEALLRAMRREIDRTSRLVRDLLFLASSDRTATFEFQLVDLSNLCAEVAEQARLMLNGRALRTDIIERIVVPGDKDRIEQVVLNLLDNAIRHTSTDTQIDMRLEAVEGRACITISDSGPGIPPDLLPHVFERFSRGQRGAGDKPSSGLGLAIARAIVEAHGGMIVATNRPGGGASFRVELPLLKDRGNGDHSI